MLSMYAVLLHNFEPVISDTEAKIECSTDADQLTSQNPADLDLHCFQRGMYPQSAG